MFKSIGPVEIHDDLLRRRTVEKYRLHGNTWPTDWATGQPKLDADYIVCTHIQVVYAGVNLTTRRLRADHLQLARQAQQPLPRHGQQDLLGAAGDRQAAGVEEVVHLLVLDRAGALGQVHPELGERLPVPHADQLARAGLRPGILPDRRRAGRCADRAASRPAR